MGWCQTRAAGRGATCGPPFPRCNNRAANLRVVPGGVAWADARRRRAGRGQQRQQVHQVRPALPQVQVAAQAAPSADAAALVAGPISCGVQRRTATDAMQADWRRLMAAGVPELRWAAGFDERGLRL